MDRGSSGQTHGPSTFTQFEAVGFTLSAVTLWTLRASSRNPTWKETVPVGYCKIEAVTAPGSISASSSKPPTIRGIASNRYQSIVAQEGACARATAG